MSVPRQSSCVDASRVFAEAIRNRLERLGCRKTRLLLAVSGGADSMAMLRAIDQMKDSLELDLVVGTVDHGLRPEAFDETRWVETQAHELGIPCEISKLTTTDLNAGKSRGSLQEWARVRRYEVLAQMARRASCSFVATAHTRDDQAETVLLRMVRGTGIEGLAGISPCRSIDERGDILLIRPLLDVSRREVESFLEQLPQEYVRDPSNKDGRFARVRVRKEILPLLEQLQPGVGARLACLAQESGAIHDYLEKQISESDKLIKTIRLFNGVKVEYNSLQAVPRSLWGTVLRLALRRVRGDLRSVGRVHVEPIEQFIKERKSTGSLPLPGEASVCLDQGDVFFFPGPLPPAPTGAGLPSPVGAGQWRLRFAALGALCELGCNRPDVARDLEVRARKPGDRLYGSSTKFKELMIKRKVPRPYRDFVPVLAYGDQVIAAPAILSSRMEGVEVQWLLEEASPVLDLGFGP